MKFAMFLIVLVLGIGLLFVVISMSGAQKDFGAAANASAVEILGSNYSEFGGMPQIFAFWWIVPIFVFGGLVTYSLYKIVKR